VVTATVTRPDDGEEPAGTELLVYEAEVPR
jgi:hypothetical protein